MGDQDVTAVGLQRRDGEALETLRGEERAQPRRRRAAVLFEKFVGHDAPEQALRQQGTNGFVMNLKFLNYDQSNQCKSMRDSSVSYASAVYTFG